MADKEIPDLSAASTLDGTELVHLVQSGNSRKVAAKEFLLQAPLSAADQATARATVSAALKGHINGLTVSNNATDATNDIDIAAGEAASTETNPVLMVLASALTKRLDASWAVGTGNGGLDTGSIADTTYHVWLIRRSDTGVVDALFSTSATSPTMPTDYDQKCLIFSIRRISGAIKPFKHYPDRDLVEWETPVADASVNNPGTSAVTRTLTLPTGRQIDAYVFAVVSANGSCSMRLSDLAMPDIVPNTSNATVFVQGTNVYAGARDRVRTNTSAQIRSRASNSDASVWNFISTIGYYEPRGRAA